MRSANLHRSRANAVVVTTAIWFISVTAGPAHGQVPAEISGGMINLGGRGSSSAEGALVTPERSGNQFEFNVRAGFATDYIYRGTTLSDHKPAVSAAFEALFPILRRRFGGQCQVADTTSGRNRGQRRAPKIGDIDLGYVRPTCIPAKSARPTALIIGRRASARISGSATRRVAGGSLIRQTFPILAPGAGTPLLVWVTTSQADYCRRRSDIVLRRRLLLVEIVSGAWRFRCPPISIGKPASRLRKIFSLDLRYCDQSVETASFLWRPQRRPGGSVDRSRTRKA